ncbi:6657_t:CDS:2, partial [Dentiscutata erythropus]
VTILRSMKEEVLNNRPVHVPESLRRKIRQIREELMVLARDAQLIIDSTGAYVILGDNVTNLMKSVSDDTLFPYVMDVMTAPEEGYDSTKDMSDSDITGLLSIAINPTNSNGQRVNAYRRLGDYIHAAQMERTTTSIEQELRTYSHQNGSRIRTIALKAKGLAQGAEMLRPKDLYSVTPDWLYRLLRQEYERLVQICGKTNSRTTLNYSNNDVGSQELPFEGGNVCGDDERLVRWYEDSSAENMWYGNTNDGNDGEVQMMEMMELYNDGNDGVEANLQHEPSPIVQPKIDSELVPNSLPILSPRTNKQKVDNTPQRTRLTINKRPDESVKEWAIHLADRSDK